MRASQRLLARLHRLPLSDEEIARIAHISLATLRRCLHEDKLKRLKKYRKDGTVFRLWNNQALDELMRCKHNNRRTGHRRRSVKASFGVG